jgi:N-acylneuraminate cytidylyltransferase
LVWQYKNYKFSPLNYNPFKRPTRQTMLPTLIENGSIYITKKKIFKTKKNRLAGKISSYVMESYSKIELDTKNDLKFFSVFLNPKIRKKLKIINPNKTK